MRRFLFLLICLIVFPAIALADAPVISPDQYFIARIVEVRNVGPRLVAGIEVARLDATVVVLSGSERGREVTVKDGEWLSGEEPETGDLVTLRKSFSEDGSGSYDIEDRYRLRALLFIGLFFFALVFFFGSTRGLGAMLGLLVSIGVLYWYIIPQLISGANPLLITISGALLIAVVSNVLGAWIQ